MLEGTDDMVFLDERKVVLLREMANVRVQGLIFTLSDLIHRPFVPRPLPRAGVLAGEEGAKLFPRVNRVLGESRKSTFAPLRELDRQVVCHYVGATSHDLDRSGVDLYPLDKIICPVVFVYVRQFEASGPGHPSQLHREGKETVI